MKVEQEIPDKINDTTIRLVSFNINGLKTLKHYHPWNELQNYAEMFSFLKTDIISFQELKLQRSDIDLSIADIKGYRSFITVPKSKKGYSGVGVFVRKPHIDESIQVKDGLSVMKVEEGITGWLDIKGVGKSYRKLFNGDSSSDDAKKFCIGGYPDLDNNKIGEELDSQGRCILIELKLGIVIISVYCPANSMATEEGENLRCLFLECLLQRADNLRKLGKEVVIMGDINVSPSLIDNDEYISSGLQSGILKKGNGDFELINLEESKKFKTSTQARKLLNSYLCDISESAENNDKVLFDLGRQLNPKKLKLYTCWNTLKNNRPMNIGSRIDLFLATKKVKDAVSMCSIWNFLYGSDHCPIYCDVDLGNKELLLLPKLEGNYSAKHFDAKSFYDLHVSRCIDSFFGSSKPAYKNKATPETETIKNSDETNLKRKSNNTSYVSRKKQIPGKNQATLSTFFANKEANQDCDLNDSSVSDSLFVPEDDNDTQENDYNNNKDIDLEFLKNIKDKPLLSTTEFKKLLDQRSALTTPCCKHNQNCILRTVKQGKNAGRKFWCCAKRTKPSTWEDPNVETNDKQPVEADCSCGFFKWASK